MVLHQVYPVLALFQWMIFTEPRMLHSLRQQVVQSQRMVIINTTFLIAMGHSLSHLMVMRLVHLLRNISLLLEVLEAVRGLEEQVAAVAVVLADIEQQPDSLFQPQVVHLVGLHTPSKSVLVDLVQAIRVPVGGMAD
jgi:hypothetical protein